MKASFVGTLAGLLLFSSVAARMFGPLTGRDSLQVGAFNAVAAALLYVGVVLQERLKP